MGNIQWTKYLETLEYVFTLTVTLFDTDIPFLWTIVAGVTCCCCSGACYFCCCRKRIRARRKGAKPKIHKPNVESPHNPDAGDVEIGKSTGNPAVDEKDTSNLTTGKKSDEPPPAARKKSIRASLGRAASKLIGKEVEKWKPFTHDDGRTYYINQDTNESVWEIPAGQGGDGKKGKSPWIKSVDDEGRTYFYNTESGESRWTDPELDAHSENAGLPAGWQIIQDSSGRSYYYNAQTGDSQWDKPKGPAEIMDPSNAPTTVL